MPLKMEVFTGYAEHDAPWIPLFLIYFGVLNDLQIVHFLQSIKKEPKKSCPLQCIPRMYTTVNQRITTRDLS